MTVSGAWSRYRRALRPRSPRLDRWQQMLADALDQNVAIGVRRLSLIISAAPQRELSSPPPDGQPTVSPSSAVPKCFMCRVPTRMLIQATATTWSWQSQT
jgi:hypothetical protein